MKNAMKKLLSLALALVLIVGVFPMATFAAENDAAPAFVLDEEALGNLIEEYLGVFASEYEDDLRAALEGKDFDSLEEVEAFINKWIDTLEEEDEPAAKPEADKAGNVEVIVPVVKPEVEDKEEEDDTYVIHLNTYGDGYHDSVEVVDGIIPELPTPENTSSKAFLYWFQTETGDKLVAGEEYKYERDIYAMAKWQDIPMSDEEKEETTYTLTLDSNTGDTSKSYRISVRYGWEIGNDLYDFEPERKGYKFIGWFLNGKPIDHTTKWNIAGDATAYAKWAEGDEDYEEPENVKGNFLLKIFANFNTEKCMTVNIDEYAEDGKISWGDAYKVVSKYYEQAEDDDDMDMIGLFTKSTWNGGDYDKDDAKEKIYVDEGDKLTVYVMVYDAKLISDSDDDIVMRIYLNGNTTTVAKVVNMEKYAGDGKIKISEATKVIEKYYEEKYNDDDMDIDGLFTAKTWNDGDYKMKNAADSIKVNEKGDTIIYVMVRDAQKISSGVADSSNPKTGDTIFMAVTVMALSASALAAVYVFSKKRAAK